MIIEITGVTSGQSPYDVFLCDTGGTSCFYISGTTNIPPSIIIDTENYFPNEENLLLRIIDTNGCVFDEIQDCSSGTTGTCICNEYELLWGHPGIVSISYTPCCPSGETIIETVEYPNPFTFSSSTTPNILSEFGGIVSLIGDICPCNCYCWSLTPGVGPRGYTGSTFNYTDCDNVEQTIIVTAGTADVCSIEMPTIISGLGSISLSPLVCQGGICTYPTEPVFISTCDIITNFSGNEIIRAYFPSTNTNAILNGFLSGAVISGGGDIAHTANKMWISYAATSAITEYDIILSPFSGVYNRDITFTDCVIGAGLSAIDDTTLITTSGTTATSDPQTVVEVDISGVIPIITNKFNLPIGRIVSGDIIYTTTNKLIVTTQDSTDKYISQYDYSTGTLEIDVIISPTILTPYGLFTYSGSIYITNQNGEIYLIDKNSPYSISLIQNAGINIGGASQLPECNDVEFT